VIPDFSTLALGSAVPGAGVGSLEGPAQVSDFFVVPVAAKAVWWVFLALVLAWWPACRALRSDDPPESPWAQGGLRFLAIWLPCFAAMVVVRFVCRFLHVEPAVQPVLAEFPEAPVWGRILMAVHGIALAPLYEEVIFRKWLQDFLIRRTGLRAGIALTVFFFVLLHCSLQAALPLAILAVGLSVARIRTGSLIPCIVMHVLHNATVFLFLGLALAMRG
jgi:membrane protease YdiL (CAAX protease family)